ncbi:hypothetical protein AFV6_gp22 [Betalipothrixvirus pozzuoliense]|uniref:Uncharacterized protein n=1 Tax=Betalipothrixvirus pozzuoliense TaxID=346882 RepID=A7WKH6_9VIRU|nr:hypothetical protein AFV6_gp22 [Acidianus filamentous virus 6]CAJ31576.1 hypothetical protein [Acidianus filamentous virus 6]
MKAMEGESVIQRIEKTHEMVKKLIELESQQEDICIQIYQMIEQYEDTLLHEKGREKFLQMRTEIHSLCMNAHRSLFQLKHVFADLLYES